MRRGLRNGHTWIAEAAGRPVATITSRAHGNQDLWTRPEQDAPAVYVSRLIVTRSAAGLGVGSAMIDWAAERGVRDWNAQWIRIDVWTTNVALHNYYEKRGFRFCRIASCKAEDYPSAALFQKPTSEIDLAAARSSRARPGQREATGGCGWRLRRSAATCAVRTQARPVRSWWPPKTRREESIGYPYVQPGLPASKAYDGVIRNRSRRSPGSGKGLRASRSPFRPAITP